MLKYIVILLDDNAISYCHYQNKEESRLMPVDTLKKGIVFAMKNDLKIQYVLPKYKLPQEYYELMDSMFHDNIGPLEQIDSSGIVVVDGIEALMSLKGTLDKQKRYIIRTSINVFFEKYCILKELFAQNISVNIVFTDIESFTEDKIGEYQAILRELGNEVGNLIITGHNFNTNILTDRIVLDDMNNCGAGDICITLAPDGNFYPCPAFYYDQMPYYKCGNIEDGINIRDKKLFTLECSPLCKRCDAYHCKRCVWLNKKLTCEINIPSRQQCVVAHIERNASRDLLEEFHKHNLLEGKRIEIIDYLDPFDEYNSL